MPENSEANVSIRTPGQKFTETEVSIRTAGSKFTETEVSIRPRDEKLRETVVSIRPTARPVLSNFSYLHLVDEFPIFSDDYDSDHYALKLRDQFANLMTRLTGEAYPPVEIARTRYDQWLDHVHSLLAENYFPNLARLQDCVATLIDQRTQGDPTKSYIAESMLPVFDEASHPFARETLATRNQTSFIITDEFRAPPTPHVKGSVQTHPGVGLDGVLRPTYVMHIFISPLLTDLDEGFDLEAAVDRYSHGTLTHEQVHMCQRVDIVFASQDEFVYRQGVSLISTARGEYIKAKRWGLEAVPEFLCQQMDTDFVAYPDATFVLAVLDQLDTNFLLEAMYLSFVEPDSRRALDRFNAITMYGIYEIFGNYADVYEFETYLNHPTHGSTGDAMDIHSISKLMHALNKSDHLRNAARKADQILGGRYSESLAVMLQELDANRYFNREELRLYRESVCGVFPELIREPEKKPLCGNLTVSPCSFAPNGHDNKLSLVPPVRELEIFPIAASK